MKHRLLFLLKFLLVMLILFGVMKVVFMLYNAEEGGFTFGDIGAVWFHGLPLDLSTSLYLLILPWAVCLASVWIKGRWAQRVMSVYGWVVAALLSLILVGDCALYEYWQFKLDATIFNYIFSPQSVVASVSGLFLFVGVLAVVMLTVVIGAAVMSVSKRAFGRCRRRWRTTVVLVLLTPFMFLGIRGGVGRSTMNVGSVYFSSNQFLNQSAINPAFSLLASSMKVMDFHRLYRFMPDKEADSLFRSLHYSTVSAPAAVVSTPAATASTQSSQAEQAVAPMASSTALLRTQRPNIVLFILEGFGSNLISKDRTPNFLALSGEGVYFSGCYANSFRTDRGIISALSGYPAFPDFSIMKIPEKSRSLPSVAAALRDAGYSTSYLYGGDINFTNQKSYLLSTGFQRAEGDLSFPLNVRRTHSWGVADHILLDTLYHRILRLARQAPAGGQSKASAPARKPFFLTCQTLSSHEDWRVPYSRFPQDKKANAFAYVDAHLGRLIRRLKQTPEWDNLLLVFVADHGIAYPDGLTEANVSRCHIPLLFAGGAIRRAATIPTVCSQSDLPATLLGMLGLGHEEFRFSRDILSATYSYPCALHAFSNGLTFIDSTGATVYDLRSRRVITTLGDSARTNRRLRLGQALLQSQIRDFDAK